MFYNIVRVIARILLIPLMRISVIGDSKLEGIENVVICPNHKSNIDPVLVSLCIKPQISWLAKKELFKNKFFSHILKALGAIPIDRENSDISAIRSAMGVLKSGKALGVFIEGTRVKNFDENNAKSGAIMLGNKTNSSFVPIYIDSHYKLFSKTTIYIGSLVTYNNVDGSKMNADDYAKYSKELLADIYALPNSQNKLQG